MPKDNHDAVKPPPMTLADVLADMEAAQSEPIELSELPPIYAADEIRRTPRTQPLPDLSGLVKLWQLIGEGNTGKTVVARYLIEKLIAHDKQGQSVMAALAPGSRNLADFAPGVVQPPAADPRATAAWATARLAAMQKLRWGGIWDFGGGDMALRLMVEAQPDMPERVEQEGMAIVAAYLFSPRLDDLAFLKTYERLGYRPRATALILNLGKADSPSAYNDIRRQPEYKAALDRGAVELWLPPLTQRVALAIEKARVLFAQARDGIVPDGKRPADISAIERVAVREWLMRTEAEFADIERAGWMPWT
nr:hypothetical protein [uncultured Rhodopila sp.]